MSEIENQDVTPEVVNPSNEEIASEQEPVQEPKRGSQEYNFREMRQVLEAQQQRIRELETYHHQAQQSQQDHADDLDHLSEDDFVTYKQAQKLADRKAQEALKKQAVESLEDRTRLKFRDYDEVVSDENINNLIEDDRELAETIRNSPNPFAAAYKFIKKSSFYKEKEDSMKKRAVDAERLVKNSSKPVSSNAIQSKPIAGAGRYAAMTSELKNELLQEMSQAASRR